MATKVASSQFASVRSTVCSLGRDRYGDFRSYREQFHFSDCKLTFKLTFSSVFVLLPLEVVGVHEIAFKAASFSIYTFFLPLCCLREREREVGEKFTVHSSAALGLLASLVSLLTGLIDVC